MATRYVRVFCVLGALAAVVACSDDATRPGGGGRERLGGTWGGEHVALDVSLKGASLEFDCAIGTIDQPVVARADGTIKVRGTYTRASGGPAHMGDEPDIHPAVYTGRLEGDVLTLKVTLTDLGIEVGPFTLRRGEPPMLFLCA
jgi:hypothetical protein